MTKAIAQKNAGAKDVWEAIANFQLAALLGWQDVAQRYRRSRIGAFWLTINMGVLIGALGLVFGTIFNAPMSEFLPFICIGLIVWSYYSQLISDGCACFIANSDTMLQLPVPFFTYILRAWWRNTIILVHNFIIFPIVLLIFVKPVSIHVLLAVPGFLLASLNILWMMVVLAILCTRYRDLAQIIQNIMQISLYLTPVMWEPSRLPAEARFTLLLNLNPFYHLISVVREPLLGSGGTFMNWLVVVSMAIAGWAIAILLLNRYRTRVTYWL